MYQVSDTIIEADVFAGSKCARKSIFGGLSLVWTYNVVEFCLGNV